jgi:hypothetical protein
MCSRPVVASFFEPSVSAIFTAVLDQRAHAVKPITVGAKLTSCEGLTTTTHTAYHHGRRVLIERLAYAETSGNSNSAWLYNFLSRGQLVCSFHFNLFASDILSIVKRFPTAQFPSISTILCQLVWQDLVTELVVMFHITPAILITSSGHPL